MKRAVDEARSVWGPVTDWSIHPRALASLPAFVGDGPLLILEFGTGFSTVALHRWVRYRGQPTRIVSFEHQSQQIERLRTQLDEVSMACVRSSRLGQVTEAQVRSMLASPAEAPSIWRERADLLPEDLYDQTRVARAFYNLMIDDPPQVRADEQLLVILDGPNGSGRSIAFPLLALASARDSFWLIDDWNDYPFLEEMAQVFALVEERTERVGNKRWKLVRARQRLAHGSGTPGSATNQEPGVKRPHGTPMT